MRAQRVVMAMVLFSALALWCSSAVALAGETAGEPQFRYIIVLKPGLGPDPDVASYGGSVQASRFGRMFVTLPPSAVEGLAKNERVKYIQRSLLPGEMPPAPAPPLESGHLAAGAASVPRLVPEPAGTGSWTTGTYKYDEAGNITFIGTTAGALNSDGKSNAYAYDLFGRIRTGTANFAAGDYSQSFLYNAAGNITDIQTTGPNGTFDKSITVNPATNRLFYTGVTYDPAGNLTSDGSTNQTRFDSLSMMTEKFTTAGGEEFYVYTAENQRIGVKTPNFWWTWSIRDESGKVLRQYQSIVGLATADWLWLEDYAYDGDQLLAAERPPEEGGRRHFHLDHLGTPRLETGATGGLMARHDYLPFGQEITSIRQELDEGYDRIDPMHFTGHERDFAGTQSYSGDYLDYMHARYYEPVIGRLFSIDPVSGNPDVPQSWNRYTYVLNNPINNTDPSGTCTVTSPMFVQCVQLIQKVMEVGWEAFYNTAAHSGMGNIFLGAQTGDRQRMMMGQMQLDHEVLTMGLLSYMDVGGAEEDVPSAGSIRDVNPQQGTQNCVACSIATSATLSGRPASALNVGPLNISVVEQNLGGVFKPVASEGAIVSTMSKAGNGAQGVVYVGSGKAGEVGHVFNVINQKGAIRFVDGQTGGAANINWSAMNDIRLLQVPRR